MPHVRDHYSQFQINLIPFSLNLIKFVAYGDESADSFVLLNTHRILYLDFF